MIWREPSTSGSEIIEHVLEVIEKIKMFLKDHLL